jgi:alpha-ketoglutarate-dependent taurine dioxygenase
MIWEKKFSRNDAKAAFTELREAWALQSYKVFVLRATDKIDCPRDFFESHFLNLGTPVALAEDVTAGDRANQRNGEIWTEVRYDPRHPDAYRHSANAQPLHTDGSYIPEFPNATLMTCVANAGEGGETTFIDGNALVEALQLEDPELLSSLCETVMPHARSGDRRVEKTIDFRDDGVWVNWNFYCVDPETTDVVKVLAKRFFEFLQNSPTVKRSIQAVKLLPGDAVAWKDRRILHGRNHFVANNESERFLWKCAIDIGNLG